MIDWKHYALVAMTVTGLLGNIGQLANVFYRSSSSRELSFQTTFDNTEHQLRQYQHQQQEEAEAGKKQHDEDTLICKSNPYLNALKDSIETVIENMDNWLKNVNVYGAKATSK